MNIEQEIKKRASEIIRVKRRLFVIKCISDSKKSVIQECEEFGVPRSSFYEWRKRYELEGEDGLKRKKPIAINHPNKIPQKELFIQNAMPRRSLATRFKWMLSLPSLMILLAIK